MWRVAVEGLRDRKLGATPWSVYIPWWTFFTRVLFIGWEEREEVRHLEDSSCMKREGWMQKGNCDSSQHKFYCFTVFLKLSPDQDYFKCTKIIYIYDFPR